MINYFLCVIMAHFVGDYLFQTEYMAMNKGKSNYILLAHCFCYGFGVMIITKLFNVNITELGLLIIIGLHFPIDYLKARSISTKYLTDNRALLVDQVLHYILLFIFINN